MNIDYKHLIRKILILDRQPDFAKMRKIYNKDDLFATYRALSLWDSYHLKRSQMLMKLTTDNYIAFDRVMRIIGEKYAKTKNDDERLLAYLQSMQLGIKPPVDPNRATTKSLTPEILKDRYLVQNKSLQDIAIEFNGTRTSICALMNKCGIERRSRSQARTMAIEQGKFGNAFQSDTNINEHFFAEWSEGMAWVLGLLFTDGCLCKVKNGFRVTYSTVDSELIDKVKALMNSTRQAYFREQWQDKSKHIYSYPINRKKMTDDLIKLGLIERKSLIMQFPLIPEKYVRHFIRGCWDGDGSIYISSGKVRASYVCGSYDFIKRFVHKLYENGIYRSYISSSVNYNDRMIMRDQYQEGKYPLLIHKAPNASCYEIKIGDNEHLKLLHTYFYDGVDEQMYLKRKKMILEEGLKSAAPVGGVWGQT
jgi:hypothetical protein